MAERLYYEFQNDKEIIYRVSIHDQDFTGTTTEIHPGAAGFLLEYEGKAEELFTPICASSCTFPIVVVSGDDSTMDSFIDDLSTADEGRLTVAIYRDPDGANDMFWCGVILTDLSEFDDNTPYDFDLVASDDIGNLKGIDYTDDGTPYTGQATIITHLLNCLNKTRTTHFWATDDVYARGIQWMRYAVGTGIGTVTYDVLPDIGFVHEEMYDTNENGVLEYKSAYVILEGICQTFQMTLVQDRGIWYFQSRQVNHSSSATKIRDYKKDGTYIGLANANNFFPINDTTGARRLTGYQYAFLNPANKTVLDYKFNGRVSIIRDTWNEDDFGVKTEQSELYIVPASQPLTAWYYLTVDQTADATRTGDDRFIRYNVQAKIKCGIYYLNRQVIPLNIGTVQFLDDGTQVEVFGFVYGNITWTTDDTNRCEWLTSPINALDGGAHNQFYGVITTGLPADSTGVEITMDVAAYDAGGTTSNAITAAALADAVVSCSNVEVWIGDGENSSGDTVRFKATDDNNAREVIELGDAFLGDNISNSATRGSLRLADGSYTVDNWYVGLTNTDRKFVGQKLVQQHMAQRRTPTNIMRGTLYHDEISMTDTAFYQSKVWVIFNMRYNANLSEYSIEAFDPVNDTGGITVAEPDRFDEDGSEEGGSSGVALGNALASEGNSQQAEIANRVAAAIRPASEPGIAIRNEVGDTYGTTLRGPVGLAADEVLTLPTGFWMAKQAASPLSSSGVTYFMPLASGYSLPNTSLDIQGRFMLPFDVEVVNCVILCENAAGATVVNLIVNGSTVDTLTPTILAGTPLVLNFSGNNVDQGDTVSISINGTNAPGDSYITLGLRIK